MKKARKCFFCCAGNMRLSAKLGEFWLNFFTLALIGGRIKKRVDVEICKEAFNSVINYLHSLNPNRETVSIWLAALFVILSLGKIGWDARKEKLGR